MSIFARRLQTALPSTGDTDETLFGALYGRTITLNQHTLADLPAQTTAGTSRFAYTVQQSAENIRLVYINWYNSSYKATQYCTDYANAATITVQALVFPPGSSVGVPVTVGGSTSWNINGGEWVQTDPIAISVSAGQTIDVQTYVSGAQWYPTLINGGGFAAGNYATSGASKLGSTSGVLYTPAIVTGKRTGSAVVVMGDSIAYNSALGSSWGYIEKGLSGHYGLINTSSPGDRLYWYLAGRRSFSQFADSDATTAVVEYCRNDLEDSRTVAQMQANLITLWTTRSSAGQRVIQTTITPHTTSTDSWATTANQTVSSTAIEARRVQLNDWVRAGAPILSGAAVAVGTVGALLAGDSGHPLYGYWEITDNVETARNSGIWKAAYTTDGLHPSTTGITAAALGVDYSMVI